MTPVPKKPWGFCGRWAPCLLTKLISDCRFLPQSLFGQITGFLLPKYSQVFWPMTLNKELPRTMGRTSLPVFNERYIRKGKKKKKSQARKRETTQCNTAKLHQPRTNMAAHRHRHALIRHVNNVVDCCSVFRLSNTTLWAPHLVYKQLYIDKWAGGGDSSVVRAPDSWLKGRGFESLLERRENFLLQGRLSVLTLISVSVPPPCYRSST